MQKDIFLNGEGDNYFIRNIEKMDSNSATRYDIYCKYIREGSRILFIGCSAGANLNYIYQQKKCECWGIDPSIKAIEYGRDNYKHLNFVVGTADELDFPDEHFDMVIFGFCFYLIDRKLLSKSIWQADRVLKNEGILGIIDFDAKYPSTRDYRHIKGVLTYKMDYSSLFLCYPHFSLIEKKNNFLNMEELNMQNLTSDTILYKDYNMSLNYRND